MKGELKVKLEMAKFLQQTLDDMAPQAKGRSSQSAKDFSEFIVKVIERIYWRILKKEVI